MDHTEGPSHPRRDQEHRRIVAAVRARDDTGAAMELARHLARSALTLIGHLAPDRDVPATRAAVRLVAAS